MTEFEIVIICIIGVGTLSVFLNIYLTYRINKVDNENEDLKEWIIKTIKRLEESNAK
jgi:hypothetical protein